MRICNNDTTADTNFESYFEIQLECGEMAVPTAATFNSFDSTIAVSVVTDTENVVCVYELSLITSSCLTNITLVVMERELLDSLVR